jgi:ubiquinone/menaquinone biosynthesis C-methylase UbiE
VTDHSDYILAHCDYFGPVLAPALRALALPPGSHGLDACCGPGGYFPMLLDAVGPEGRVTGIDISPNYLARAEALAREHGFAGRVTPRTADIGKTLPFPDNTFDWCWMASVPWEPIFEGQSGGIAEILRVVKPGGRVIVFYGDWQRDLLLPGYHRLETLAVRAIERRYGLAVSALTSPTERVHQRLAEAGLRDVTLSILPLICQSPLPEAARRYLSILFETDLLPAVEQCGAEVGMSASDIARCRGMLTEESPGYVLDGDDYYCVSLGVLASGVTR